MLGSNQGAGKAGKNRPQSHPLAKWVSVAALLIVSMSARAVEPSNPTDFSAEESQIPQSPSAPPSLSQQAPTDLFHCERKFVYQGKTLDCDSNIQRDGENLRPIIQDVPAAISELDAYQRNRRTLRKTAYVASLGVLAMIAGYFATHATGNGKFRNDDTSLRTLSYLVVGGAVLTAGSFIYGFTLYKTNESHLGNAINEFNQARPNTPIEIQFSTGIRF